MEKFFYFSKKPVAFSYKGWVFFFTEFVAHRLFQLEIICFQPFLLLRDNSFIFIVRSSATQRQAKSIKQDYLQVQAWDLLRTSSAVWTNEFL